MPETQAASEPSAYGGLQWYEGECLGNGQQHAENEEEVPEFAYQPQQEHACQVEDSATEHDGPGPIAVAQHTRHRGGESADQVVKPDCGADDAQVPAECAVLVVQGRDHDPGLTC